MRINVASYAFMGQACYAKMKEITAKGENAAMVNFGSCQGHRVKYFRLFTVGQNCLSYLTRHHEIKGLILAKN